MASALPIPPVLIADDNPDDLFFAKRLLQKAGLEAPIIECSDGREVVTLLKSWAKEHKAPPQAVFLDVKMPGLDGFQTLKWIRAQKHLQSVCVVMLSGSGEHRDVELARSLGANDYLVKYPSPAEFARVLAGCSEQAGTVRGWAVA